MIDLLKLIQYTIVSGRCLERSLPPIVEQIRKLEEAILFYGLN
jgi:hypothetical protein